MMDLTIRTYMAIMAERDAAIQERNMSLDERKRAFAERDMAMLQRDAAISERNSAIQERDEAITALRLLEESMNENRNQQQIMPSESRYYPPRENENGNEKEETDYFNFEEVASETATKPKARRGKRTKSGKSAAKLVGGSRDNIDDEVSEDDENKLNRIMFDETIMPTPVCTCTGAPQPCYRWGNGGWQSACCTTAISMYPLPQVSNKRYTRIGGRKMSGSAFSKLLNRIALEGYSLSAPLDLKDHWAKHGTNRYTIAK